MTINNPDKYLAAAWDWGFLKKCFGSTGIEPSDVDGMVERRGNFLVLEAKPPGRGRPLAVRIKKGQLLNFEAMARTGIFTVIILFGKPNEPEEYCLVNGTPGKSEIKACDLAEIQNIVATWFEAIEAEAKLKA